MSCCRNHFTNITPTNNTKKLRVLARIYVQMRSGTAVQKGDWLKVKVDGKTWRVIYKGANPISSTCGAKDFPWKDCMVVSKDSTPASPFREKADSPLEYFNMNKVESFEITAPFAYPSSYLS